MTTHADMVIYADLVVKNLTAEIEGQPKDSHHDRLRYARSRAEQVRDYLAAIKSKPEPIEVRMHGGHLPNQEEGPASSGCLPSGGLADVY